MHTQADHEQLIQKGIVVAGKLITLHSEVTPQQHGAVKITLKDLPLHSISNEQVLEALKDVCTVESLRCITQMSGMMASPQPSGMVIILPMWH